METMTCSLFSRAPGQERETSTDTVTSLLFNEFRERDGNSTHARPTERTKIYPSMKDLTEDVLETAKHDLIIIRCLHFQFPIVLMWSSLSRSTHSRQ